MIDRPRQVRFSRRGVLGAAALGGIAWRGLAPVRAMQADLDAVMAAMTPAELAARMFMLPVSGTALTPSEAAWLSALKPGGVILVGNNFGTPDEVRALVAAIHATNPELPPLVALDQEGGIVSRIADDPAPDAATMGTLPLAEISTLAGLRAETLARYRFDVNFAPVADVAFAPDSFMSGRSFGASAEVVAEDVAAYLEGVAGSPVHHCVKHFPGHGGVSVDSHEALPVLDVDPAVWWDNDALPFRVAVELGVPMVMLGHLVMPAWDESPASLSPEAVRVLREDLAFDGVVVSDDLGMGALAAWGPLAVIDLAVAAGTDLLLFVIAESEPSEMTGHLAARIESGEVSRDRITASVQRLLRMQLGEP
jgi:beta-N-acetylhexosaminidase